MSTQTFEQRRAALQSQLEQLDKEEAADAELRKDTTKYLAVTLHQKLCKHNHTDGCGWYYEMLPKTNPAQQWQEHDWTGYHHQQYYSKAQLLQKVCERHKITVEQGLEIAAIMWE